MVIKVRIIVTLGWRCLLIGKGMKEPSGVLEMYCLDIVGSFMGMCK